MKIRLIMEKNLPLHLKEVIFSSKDPKISSQISNLLKTGAIRKIAPRVYSPNMDEPVEIIIRRNINNNNNNNNKMNYNNKYN